MRLGRQRMPTPRVALPHAHWRHPLHDNSRGAPHPPVELLDSTVPFRVLHRIGTVDAEAVKEKREVFALTGVEHVLCSRASMSNRLYLVNIAVERATGTDDLCHWARYVTPRICAGKSPATAARCQRTRMRDGGALVRPAVPSALHGALVRNHADRGPLTNKGR